MPGEVTEPDRCIVCGLMPQVLGCKPGACVSRKVPVDVDGLLNEIIWQANEVSKLAWDNGALPIAATLAAAAVIRAKIKTDGDDPEIWFDLIRHSPASEAGLAAMERLLGFARKGQQ